MTDWNEVYEERAAIMEYHGRLSRKDAESQAGQWVAMERLKETAARRDRERALRPKRSRPAAPAVTAEKQASLPGMDDAGFSGG